MVVDGGDAVGRGPGDGGFCAMELVVTLALLGLVVGPVLSAVTTGLSLSARQRTVAAVETVVQNAADRVNRAPKQCDYSVYVDAAALYQGWDPTLITASTDHYVPGATPAQPGVWTAGCSEADGVTQLLVQRVTIAVTSPDGEVERSIEVVKSDV